MSDDRKTKLFIVIGLCALHCSFLSREHEMRKLFPRMVLEDGEEKFRIDPAEVRRHALMVVEGLGLAVDYLQDTDKLNRFLRIVGTRHHHANVKPEMLTVS